MSGNICSQIWSALSGQGKKGLPAPFPPGKTGTQGGSDSLGHGGGVDDDARAGSTRAQEAGAAANEEGSANATEDTVQGCPECRVAIVVGHTTKSPGAMSQTIGVAEWSYNNDIAGRTVTKVTAKSGGKVQAKVFYRTSGGGYSKEMARVYDEVKAWLAPVRSTKRIAIELHYNSSTSTSARYAEILHKGDVAFAQKGAARLAAIFGGNGRARHYSTNARGQSTFVNGPANTYLMEPFFGSNPASAEIAKSAAGKDALADAYATMLVEWAK